MRIEDVQITADQKQTPELNEDGTPKTPVVDPTLQEDLNKDDDQEDNDEGHIDDKDEDDEEFNEDGSPKEKTPVVVPPVVTPASPEVDYKKKFGESTRRNQIVESQFRELQKVLGDITRQEIPSDEEMRATDPDWDYRSDFEKNLSLKLVVQERRQNHILSTIGNITKESEKAEKIVTFIEATESLKGKEEAFYDFATNPKNEGAPVDTLLKAFLYDVEEKVPAQPVAPKEKAPSLNRATPRGGNDPKPKQEGNYSDAELTALRTKNPKEYFKLIRQKKI